MTLDELKARATASEITLIEATEAATREKVAAETRRSVIAFCRKNAPPNSEYLRYQPDAAQNWLGKLEKHLEIKSDA